MTDQRLSPKLLIRYPSGEILPFLKTAMSFREDSQVDSRHHGPWRGGYYHRYRLLENGTRDIAYGIGKRREGVKERQISLRIVFQRQVLEREGQKGQIKPSHVILSYLPTVSLDYSSLFHSILV